MLPIRPLKPVRRAPRLLLPLVAALLVGCATRSADIEPLPADPRDFAAWDCDRMVEEIDRVQQRAAERAYAVDERAGNNMIVLGVGATLFWPALLAMRSNGPEAEELARLRGRYEALQTAMRQRPCADPGQDLPARQAAQWPLAVGERLVYEDRRGQRGPALEWTLQLTALRRTESEFQTLARAAAEGRAATEAGLWRQDRVGNITAAPDGALQWPHLLRGELALGAVIGGDLLITGDPQARARVRGQVVAVGPQSLAGRRFDVAVIELFGDAQRAEVSTRLEGAIVVDRTSGVLLRLDLRSAHPEFQLQRRLVRVESAGG